MITATQADKKNVVDILINSFMNNKSVEYIIKKGSGRHIHIQKLMEYSFDECYRAGVVLLSDNKKACALLMSPEKKKMSLRSVVADIKFLFTCVGLSNIFRLLVRERNIKLLQPSSPFYYLWFIGVAEDEQGKGIGTILLNEIKNTFCKSGGEICLETSTQKNIPWYLKNGFTIYNELDLGYKLYFLRSNK